jgi:VanZ family protein
MLKNFVVHYALMMLVVLAIVYGSLYPFVFRNSGSFGADLLHFAGTWNQPPQSLGDLLANLLLYMPLGLTVTLALARNNARLRASIVAVGCGTLLSLLVELTQFYDVGRVSNLSDVYLNATGALAGCAIAWGARARSTASWPPRGGPAFARLLLLVWLGWRLYPYVPTIDLHKYWRSVRPLLSVSGAAPTDIFRYALLWLSAVFLVKTGLRPQSLVRFLLVAVPGFFLAKIFIVGQVLILPDILGAVLALLLAHLVFERFGLLGIRCVAALLGLVVVLTRVLPWRPAATLKAFQWIPFFGVLHGSLRLEVIAGFEKFYLYGALLLLLVKAGMRLRTAVVLECAVLLVTSLAQIFMVGRSAEITDALVALVMGVIYALLRRRYPENGPTVPQSRHLALDAARRR